MNEQKSLIIPSAILAAGLIISMLLFVSTWKDNSQANQTIYVTGSAKRSIVSDLGVLRGNISVEAATSVDAYNELERQKPILVEYLVSKGFPKEKITFFTVNSFPSYEFTSSGQQTGKIRAYNYNQRMEIQSENVNKIKETSLEIGSLIQKGVNFNVEMPEYYYTKLSDVKVEIQSEAAKDAITRGQKIAAATKSRLGALRSARMGVLQITPKNSNNVSDEGFNDVSSIEKEITAVVNASFQIK